jgi:hypothetical protein
MISPTPMTAWENKPLPAHFLCLFPVELQALHTIDRLVCWQVDFMRAGMHVREVVRVRFIEYLECN